ncbi:MAG: hypothetical protein JNK15_06005 [Planctomycetes bacterium]|nr:hypothetical protein [Planctomycetota bacterium]
MAQDVRTQRLVVGAVLLLAACGDAPPAPPVPARTPRAVAIAELPAAGVPEAILTECHAPLRGRMDRVAATVTFADGATVQAFAELPARLRLQAKDGTVLLDGERAMRLDGGDVEAADAARARAVRTLVDVAAFGVLHRATDCRAIGTDTVAGGTASGTATLTLRPGTLLPAAIVVDGTRVDIDEYLATPTTFVARGLTTPALGTCRVVFEQGDVTWAPDFFQPTTTARNDGNRTRIVSPGSGAEPRSPTPIELDQAELQLACVRDPGTWPARVAAYAPLHQELERQRQRIAGFPVFFHADGADWLAAPFRRRPEGDAFAAPRGWDVRTVPAARWLVVYPAGDDLAARRTHGERLLADALASSRGEAAGPVQWQPFLHLQDGEPAATKLAAAVVRMAVRLR